MVENLGNQQYTVKMDGSGRVSLRNRKFLRKTEPFLPRYVTLDKVHVGQEGVDKGGDDKANEGVTEEQVIDEILDDTQRKSTRVRHSPDRF